MDAWYYRISVACDNMEFDFIVLSPPLVWSTPLSIPGQCDYMHAPTFNKWLKREKKNKNKNKKVTLHMLTHGAMWGCGLTSLMVCINDKIHDIWKRNVTIRSEIWTMNICSLGFWHIREWVILRRWKLWSLGCSFKFWDFLRFLQRPLTCKLIWVQVCLKVWPPTPTLISPTCELALNQRESIQTKVPLFATLNMIFSVLITLYVVVTLPCSSPIFNPLAISVRRYVGILLLSLLFFLNILSNTKFKHATSTYYHSWYLVFEFTFNVTYFYRVLTFSVCVCIEWYIKHSISYFVYL